MAKRFTDTEKWNDEFFMNLSATHKLFFLYLLDNCDHGGFWKENVRLAEFQIGESIDVKKAVEAFGDRVQLLAGKWFLTKFINFQYKGSLNASDKVHVSVLNLLAANGIDPSPYLAPSKPLASPYLGAKVKVKVQDKDKVKELMDGFDAWYAIYPRKQKREDALKAWIDLSPDADLQAKLKAVIPDHIQGYEWWKDDKKRFIPLPASWIRSKRWNDQFQIQKERGLAL